MARFSLQILDSVPSTMDVARENILTRRVFFNPMGEPNYGGVLAREQTAGRGQRGRVWYAEPGANLNVTYYFRRGLAAPEHAGELAILAGVAVVKALQEWTSPPAPSPGHLLRLVGRGEKSSLRLPLSREERANQERGSGGEVISFGLKWPNDVLLNGKKVGGILIEMVKAPDGDWVALIGVGINLRVQEFPHELADTATSLLREGVTPPEAEVLCKAILSTLHFQADNRQDSGFSVLLQEWRQHDRTLGQSFETEIEGKRVFGVAEGVDEKGALLLRTTEGRLLTVTTATSLRSANRPPIL